MIGKRCSLIEAEEKYPDKWLGFLKPTTLSRFSLVGNLESVCTELEFKEEKRRLEDEGKQIFWYKARK